MFFQAQGSKASLHHHHEGTRGEVAAPFFACLGNGAHGIDAQATKPALHVSLPFSGSRVQLLPVFSDTNNVPVFFLPLERVKKNVT